MTANKLFIDSDINYPFLWCLDLATPFILKMGLNIDGVEILEQDKKRLRNLAKERLLYVANHPSTIEPSVAYCVANVMGSRFRFMASRSVFNWSFGLVGEMIKRVGAFSVLSGGADRESIKTARGVLSEPRGKLVIYPEGMLSGENDNLLSFMPGFAQIGFWGLEDALKKDKTTDVKVLPTFVKYILTDSRSRLKQEIESSLRKIERVLDVSVLSQNNLLRRFLTVGRVLLEKAESEHYIIPEVDKGINYRIGRIRHVLLNYAAHKLGIQFENENAIQKLRVLFTIMDAIDAKFPPAGIPKLSETDFQVIRREIEKAYIFITIKPDYLLEYPSPERFMEWIYRLETLLFGSTKPRARKAHVLVGEPFGLMEYYASYKKDKRKTLVELTERLKRDMENLMKQGIELTYPMLAPFDAG
jgi:hypothetical protein